MKTISPSRFLSTKISTTKLAVILMAYEPRFRRTLLLIAMFSVPIIFSIRLASENFDPDVWWHLRTGEWIVKNLEVPTTDMFSIMRGTNWIAYSWLYEILIYAIHSLLGLTGFVVFGISMSVLTISLLYSLLRTISGRIAISVALTGAGAVAMGATLYIRSFRFSILFLILELYLLHRARTSSNFRHLLLLPLLFFVWANVHIQFVFGLFVYALFALEVIIDHFKGKALKIVHQGNNITNTVINAKDLKFKSGGKVGTDSGITITGLGPDTQLIAAQPGEIVMNRAAVDGYGADNLLKLNSLFGGSNANNPKSVGSGAATAMSSGGILQGAKSIIGMGKGVGDQCANTTRAALRAAGHPAAKKRTQKGDLDTPKGTGYNAPSFAASFGGTDMGQVITNKSQIKAGDIILWRADRNLGGNLNKGAITHVGIAADDGLKNQYDHNRSRGFHYRPHWHSSGGTSWFAGVRLGGKGGSVPPSPGENGGGASIGNVGDSRLDLQSSTQPSIPQYDTSKPYAGGLYTIGGGANMGAAGQQQSSAAGANQSPVPTFSADDPMNPSLLVVKSIYNIVG